MSPPGDGGLYRLCGGLACLVCFGWAALSAGAIGCVLGGSYAECVEFAFAAAPSSARAARDSIGCVLRGSYTECIDSAGVPGLLGVDAYMARSLDCRVRCATTPRDARPPPQLMLPPLRRWHVTTQDRLFAHLQGVWGDGARTMLDLGCHAGHSADVNVSDSLLFLDRFHAPGTSVLAVDAYEDFALDLNRRFDTVAPYASMAGVRKRAKAVAISPRGGRRVDLAAMARGHTTCCAGHWCNWLGELRGSSHMCEITRMRLGITPAAPWLPPSSYTAETLLRLAAPKTAFPLPRYLVPARRLDELWRSELGGGRIDFVKVDIDTSWKRMGGVATLLAARAAAVLLIEIDSSWGGLDAQWNLTELDQLAWLARHHGYTAYLKVPCVAREGRGSLESGRRRKQWVSERKHAAWLHTIASPAAPFAATRFHCTGHRARPVQDVLLVDGSEAALASLPERAAADCEEIGATSRRSTRSWR